MSRAALLLAFHPDADPDTLSEKATQAVGDLVTVTHSWGAGCWR